VEGNVIATEVQKTQNAEFLVLHLVVNISAGESVYKSSDSDSYTFKTSDSDSSIFKTPTPS
jgi:hypothetical protein